jgi:hypothetical protein
MKLPGIEKIVFGAALLIAMVSTGWFGGKEQERERLRRPIRPDSARANAADQPGNPDEPGEWAATWPEPEAQPRGPEWVYDVFTPPEIYYDDEAGEFAVTMRADEAEAAEPEGAAGLELVAVQRALFPLQLFGYVGGERHVVGSFENVRTGEVWLAGAGRELPGMNLMIVEFTVQRRSGRGAAGTGSEAAVATAVVREGSTGRLTTLTTGERAFTDELVAVVALDEDGEETRHELRQGEAVEVNGETFTADQLQRDPPGARFTVKPALSTLSRRLELRPRPPRVE